MKTNISSPPVTPQGFSKFIMSTLKTNVSSPPATTQGSRKSTMSTLKTAAACVPPRHEQFTRTDTQRLPTASVCNWGRLDLCLVSFGWRAFLIMCQVEGCDHLLHHMYQAKWERAEKGRKAHGSRKLCAHHHPACPVDHPSRAAFSSPPAATLGSSKSTMSTLTTTTASVTPRHINLAVESNDRNVSRELPTLQEDDAEELPSLKLFGIAPLLKERIPPMDGSVFGTGMCLSQSMLHVPSFMYLGFEEGVLSLVRLPFQPIIWPDIKH
jgi:hypothetical protein